MAAPQVLLLGKQDNDLFVQKRTLISRIWAEEGLKISEDPNTHADFAIALGGDGSLLSAIRKLGLRRHHIPILGIHLSPGLGFLHSLRYPRQVPLASEESFVRLIAKMLKSQSFSIERRWGLVARCTSSQKKAPQDFWAMNDIVVSKSHISRILALDVRVNQNLILSNLKGDGLIVSSATGSTGYSLSAGGPVLDPLLKATVITPVCPHRLSQRPFVLGSEVEVEITIKPGKNHAFLTADGQTGTELDAGDIIKVSTAETPVNWVNPHDNTGLTPKNYFESLRSKLGFGGE